MEPLISVIIPIYNVEAYLPRCLDSVLAQTYHNLEIILVNDGSADGCGVICDRYARQDSRIRVIHQTNRGISAARNSGLDIMAGDYLMFIDSDDWISADAVQCMYRQIMLDGSDMVIGQVENVWPDGRTQPDQNVTKNRVLASGCMLEYLRGQGTVPCYAWGKLYRSALFHDLRYHHLRRGEDVWMLPHIVEKCGRISVISNVVYYYYQRGDSIVHSSSDPQHLDSMRASLHVARMLYDNGLTIHAGAYYYAAVKEGRVVKRRAEARRLLRESFCKRERLQLASHAYAHWRCFLPDDLYRGLRKLKRVLRQSGKCLLREENE